MHTVLLRFTDLKAREAAVQHLWDRLKLTGEVATADRAPGEYILEIISEKTLRRDTLAVLGGQVLADGEEG